MDINLDQILKQLNQSDDELYAEIGRETSKSLLNKPFAYYVQVGKEWIAAKTPLLKTRLCENIDIRLLLSKDSADQDRINLILAIADFISSLKIGISPFTVSVLIFKQGVSKFCEGYEPV
jgi:hypothetical protein